MFGGHLVNLETKVLLDLIDAVRKSNSTRTQGHDIFLASRALSPVCPCLCGTVFWLISGSVIEI